MVDTLNSVVLNLYDKHILKTRNPIKKNQLVALMTNKILAMMPQRNVLHPKTKPSGNEEFMVRYRHLCNKGK